jgi:polyisoprenoid-binding protein YceI
MKVTLLFVFLFAGISITKAQQYKPVDDKSEIKFTIKNFGLNANGDLKGLTGIIKFNPQNPAASVFNVSVDVNTINTGIESRDNHLRKEDYFDVGRYPTISFVSTAISKTNDGYNVSGRITIKGVERTISFPFTVENSGDALVFSGSFSLNRRDFNVGEGSAVLSNTVNVTLKVFAVKG